MLNRKRKWARIQHVNKVELLEYLEIWEMNLQEMWTDNNSSNIFMTIVSRGDCLWKMANIKDKNNSTADYSCMLGAPWFCTYNP